MSHDDRQHGSQRPVTSCILCSKAFHVEIVERQPQSCQAANMRLPSLARIASSDTARMPSKYAGITRLHSSHDAQSHLV